MQDLAQMMHDRMIYSDNDGYWIYSDPAKSYFEVFAPDITCCYRIASIGKSIGIPRCKEIIEKHKTR